MEYTEEEKKAINVLKYLLKRRYEDEIETYDLFVSIETTLNLLEKQQKEISRLEKESADKERAYNECYCEYKNYKQYESIPKEALREKLKKFENIKIGDLKPSDCEVWSVLRNLLGE